LIAGWKMGAGKALRSCRFFLMAELHWQPLIFYSNKFYLPHFPASDLSNAELLACQVELV
jgi:hypothetical protein